MRVAAALVAATLATAPAGPAQAYSSPALFDVGPSLDSTGGAGGIYYTGSARFQGQACDGCHQHGEGGVSLRLDSLPEGLFEEGWVPDTEYAVRVDLGADRAAPPECDDAHGQGDACNLNLFAVEAMLPSGFPAGRLCPVPLEGADCPETLGAPTVASRDGTTLFASGLGFDDTGLPAFRDAATSYWFYWRSPSGVRTPAEGGDAPPDEVPEVIVAPTVDLWISAVDGDGGSTRPGRISDVDGDLTGTFHLRLRRAGALAPSADGCAVGGPGAAPGGSLAWPLALWAGLAWLASRRRRRRTAVTAALWIAAATVALTSCAQVKPWERETLARRCMQFDADPEAVLLEQHVLSYREGAAGGYGGGGGGCGCN